MCKGTVAIVLRFSVLRRDKIGNGSVVDRSRSDGSRCYAAMSMSEEELGVVGAKVPRVSSSAARPC